MDKELYEILTACKTITETLSLGSGISYKPYDMLILSQRIAVILSKIQTTSSKTETTAQKPRKVRN